MHEHEERTHAERMQNIAARLEAAFGLGEQPGRRRLLYRRLENWVAVEGWEAYRVIADVALRADAASKSGRYFSAAITAAVRQRGVDLLEFDDDDAF